MVASMVMASESPIQSARKFMELIRFSHTIFALPFALLATVWAYSIPIPLGSAIETIGTQTSSEDNVAGHLSFRWQDLLGILLCMVLARSFAMAFNRLLDHNFDAANPRTASRHLPKGDLTRTSVIGFCWACCIAFIASCTLFLPNVWPLILSIPVLAFLAGYSFTKRFTRWAHFWLGGALMMAPICVWIALRGSWLLSHPGDILPAAGLGCIVLFWVAGFDIIYACQDYEYDRSAGLHSVPAKIGIAGALRVARASHAVMWVLAISFPWLFPQIGLGWLFQVAVAIVGFLLIWEHRSVSSQSLAKINLAFFQLNSIISMVFLVVGSLDAIW